jgi:hypothetical protein
MNIHSFIKNHLTLSSQNRYRIETHKNLNINIVEWGNYGHIPVVGLPDSKRKNLLFKNEFIFMLRVLPSDHILAPTNHFGMAIEALASVRRD